MNFKYLAIAVSVALFLTVGMPIWAGYAVKIAVAAANASVVRPEFAPALGSGLWVAPIVVLLATAAAYAFSMMRKRLCN